MIWRPKKGQLVRLRYKDGSMPYHDAVGRVTAVTKGNRLVNARVELVDGRTVIVPRGNLVEAKAGRAIEHGDTLILVTPEAWDEMGKERARNDSMENN